MAMTSPTEINKALLMTPHTPKPEKSPGTSKRKATPSSELLAPSKNFIFICLCRKHSHPCTQDSCFQSISPREMGYLSSSHTKHDLFGTAATHTKRFDLQVYNLVINKVKHADKAITGSSTSAQEAGLGRTEHGPAQQDTTDEDRSYTSSLPAKSTTSL